MKDANQLDLFSAPPPEPEALVLVAFDVETTGLDPRTSDIIEIGGVRFTLNGAEQTTFQRMANPGYPVPEVITRITGITDAMVSSSPSPVDTVTAFLEWAGPEAVLVAHNAPFDAGFVNCCFRKAKIALPARDVVDSLPWARNVFPKLQNHKLGTLLGHIGVNIAGLHRSLADSMGVMQLVRHLLKVKPREEADIRKSALNIEAMARLYAPRRGGRS